VAEKKKGIGNALLGLFVVREGEEGQGDATADPAQDAAVEMVADAEPGRDAVADDLIARYASGSASGGHASAHGATASPSGGRRPTRPPPPPQPATGGTAHAEAAAAAAASGQVPEVAVDFPQVLRSAGLTGEDQSRVDKALTLLHNLPAETPIEIKRQIVAASLQAFGIPVEQIIESALLHQRAIDRHIQIGQVQTQSLLEQSTRRLAELEKEAARVKQVMQDQLGQQQGLTNTCGQKRARIQEVLDFFGKDAIQKVTQGSVKLRDRGAGGE
jgi:hypothetical protein